VVKPAGKASSLYDGVVVANNPAATVELRELRSGAGQLPARPFVMPVGYINERVTYLDLRTSSGHRP